MRWLNSPKKSAQNPHKCSKSRYSDFTCISSVFGTNSNLCISKVCVSRGHVSWGLALFWSRFYIVIVGMTFFVRSHTFFNILFNFCFPFSIWTFVSLFYLDYYFFLDFYFFFDFYFPFLHKSRSDFGFLPSFFHWIILLSTFSNQYKSQIPSIVFTNFSFFVFSWKKDQKSIKISI